MNKVLNRQSTKITCDGYKFDSKLEYDTYQILLKEFGIDDLMVHYPLLIKSQTNHFKKMELKLDFWIPSANLYVESKGILEYDFSLKLAMLDVKQPGILNKLIIVVREVDDKFRKFSKSHDLLIVSTKDLVKVIKMKRNYYHV